MAIVYSYKNEQLEMVGQQNIALWRNTTSNIMQYNFVYEVVDRIRGYFFSSSSNFSFLKIT